MFCVELMANGAPEAAVSSRQEQSRSPSRRPPETVLLAKQKKHKTKAQLHKTGVVFGAIQSGLKGRKYCISLDERKVRPPRELD